MPNQFMISGRNFFHRRPPYAELELRGGTDDVFVNDDAEYLFYTRIFNNACKVDNCYNFSVATGSAIQRVYDFSHYLADVIVFGFATSQSASIEPGEGKFLQRFVHIYTV